MAHISESGLGAAKGRKMGTPRVSIIIPAFNAGCFIQDTLASLADQTLSDFEVLIVDDGSCDTTREIAEIFRRDDPRFRVLTNIGKGVSRARNLGLATSCGEYVAFLDADDLLPSNSLKLRADWLDANPSCELVSCMWDVIGPNNEEFGLTMGRLSAPRDFSKAFELPAHICAIMGRGNLMRRLGFDPDRSHGEDYDYLVRLLRSGLVLHPLHEVAFHYRWHGASAVGANALRHISNVVDVMDQFLLPANGRLVDADFVRGWLPDSVVPRQLALWYLVGVQLVLSDAADHLLDQVVEKADALVDASRTPPALLTPADLWVSSVRAVLRPLGSRELALAVAHRTVPLLDFADRLRLHVPFGYVVRELVDAAQGQLDRAA